MNTATLFFILFLFVKENRIKHFNKSRHSLLMIKGNFYFYFILRKLHFLYKFICLFSEFDFRDSSAVLIKTSRL